MTSLLSVNLQYLTERTHKVLICIQDFSSQLWPEKCHFYLQVIKYLGFIFNHYGHLPNPANVAAIQCIPLPSNVSSLRSFLGLVSFYGSFLPSLHQIKVPLNKLLTEDIKWTWPVDWKQSFEKIKASLNSDVLLTYFDPTQKIVVAADASSHGGEEVISHIFADKSEKAIMHACSQIPDTRWMQLQHLEALALIFFFFFLLWRNFTRCYLGAASHSWQTTSHYCQYLAWKKEFQCTQLVDYNAGQSSYWDMILTCSTTRLQNLVWLMPCHVSSVCNQSQMMTLLLLPST